MSIREYLKLSGETAGSLAKRAGINKSTIFRYLNGADLTGRTIQKIIVATNGAVRAEDLVVRQRPGRV